MGALISRLVFPVLLSLAGIGLVIFSISSGQNTYFLMGALAISIVGIVAVLNALEVVTKTLRLVIVGVLVLISVGLAALDYKSIKDPIEFMQQRKKREAQVVQRLKDIRTAQIAYKAVNEKYAPSFDTLLNFIKHDSFPVIKATGFVPDTLTEDSAVILGIVSRDTVMFSVKDSIFNKQYRQNRETGKLVIDSLPIIPFSGGQEFEMSAGVIERNNVPVQVFEVKAPNKAILRGLNEQFYKPEKGLQVGSMTEPTTSGNWGE